MAACGMEPQDRRGRSLVETVPIWGLQAALAFGVVATGLLVAWLVTKPPRNLTRRSLD